jgi:hypothetical protein
MRTSDPAPVALFAFNRPRHLREAVQALQKNDLARDTRLLIFCDGPRTAADDGRTAQVREYARSVAGFETVEVIEREANLGLAESIITGVTQVCGDFGRVIVMEDDLLTAPHFLRYMNDALSLYADDPRVASIHGYWYPMSRALPETFFLRGASCWGWATWSRAWRLFERDGRKLLAALEQGRLTRLFDLDGAMPYTRMLKDQIAGRNNSWAIRWHAANFLAGSLQLWPGSSLVRNVGFDGSGTHCAESDAYAVELSSRPIRVERVEAVESGEARAALIQYHRSSRRSLPARLLSRVRRIGRNLTTASLRSGENP